MLLCRPIALLLVLSSLFVAGCGGGNDPVNVGKDLPVPPKKEKEKDKDK